MRWKHLKPLAAEPSGRSRPQGVPDPRASNVLLFSEKAGKGVRTKNEVVDGKKVRVGKPCGTKFD